MKKQYGDESVIRERREFGKRKFNSIQSGMYVEEKLISFIKKNLGNTGITMMLPDFFIPMEEADKKRKYPMEKRPSTIWSDPDGEISLTFSVLPQNVSEAELEQLRDDLGISILSIYPHYIFLEKGLVVCESKIYWTDFLAPVLGGMIYHILYVSLWEHGILLGGFNCPAAVKDDWKRIILQLISTIRKEDNE